MIKNKVKLKLAAFAALGLAALSVFSFVGCDSKIENPDQITKQEAYDLFINAENKMFEKENLKIQYDLLTAKQFHRYLEVYLYGLNENRVSACANFVDYSDAQYITAVYKKNGQDIVAENSANAQPQDFTADSFISDRGLSTGTLHRGFVGYWLSQYLDYKSVSINFQGFNAEDLVNIEKLDNGNIKFTYKSNIVLNKEENVDYSEVGDSYDYIVEKTFNSNGDLIHRKRFGITFEDVYLPGSDYDWQATSYVDEVTFIEGGVTEKDIEYVTSFIESANEYYDSMNEENETER